MATMCARLGSGTPCKAQQVQTVNRTDPRPCKLTRPTCSSFMILLSYKILHHCLLYSKLGELASGDIK